MHSSQDKNVLDDTVQACFEIVLEKKAHCILIFNIIIMLFLLWCDFIPGLWQLVWATATGVGNTLLHWLMEIKWLLKKKGIVSLICLKTILPFLFRKAPVVVTVTQTAGYFFCLKSWTRVKVFFFSFCSFAK